MSGETSAKLYEQVIQICDDLYANRQLITKKSVKKIALLQGNWSQDELEMQLPRYINEWRLNTLEKSAGVDVCAKISKLEAQVCKYKARLIDAQHIIQRLQAQLLESSHTYKSRHSQIVAQLRDLLE